MHGSCARVVAAQAVAGTGGGDQLALGGFGAKALRVNDDLGSQGNAVLVLENFFADIQRRGFMGNMENFYY